MSIQVNCIDDKKAEQELKSCPEIVRDYVKALKSALDGSRHVTNKAIAKIREQAKEISELKKKQNE